MYIVLVYDVSKDENDKMLMKASKEDLNKY